MTCQDLEARIAEFLAGELEDRSGVEEHLLACAECRSKFSAARSGWQAAEEWKVPGPSGDAIAATLAAMEPVAPSKPLLRFLQVGTMAASIVIAFVIGTSNREKPAVEKPAPVATNPVKPASTGLASLRPSVGLLYVQDEQGRPAGELAIARLNVKVDIQDGIARTEIEEVFQNRTDQRLEGTFQFPLPPDASISRLAMEIEGKLMEGEVVERQKARQTYEGIVRSMKDPALLEWMPGGMFQCRIFPIEPRSDKRIVIAYTQALSVFDGRARYVYPLAGESMRELGIGRFEFAAMIRSGSKIVKAASTSHDAPTIRLNDRAMRTTFAHSDFRPRSDFVIAYETEVRDEIQVSAHRPEGVEPGYFAAFITPRIDRDEEVRRDRKLFFLVDVSGSVARPELEAAKLVIRRMIGALGPADRFRIGGHNLMVGAMTESVAPDEAGKLAAERYLSDLAAAGASDVATALETTLSHYLADNGELVYVGEGTPTWGEKDPAKIVARLRAAVGARRISIRTVAVGSDAEKGLLEAISREFNGGSHAVSPSDDVASRADEIARTLGRSALSQLKAEFEGAVTDAAPGTLGSIHFGERLLVTGRYGAGPVKLVLTGKVHDRTIRKEFALALPEREAGHLHVKRLWAQRRLADLAAQGEAKRDETVKLSVAHQVMTPHTSFLVLENEKAYEQHQIDRTKKDADQQRDPGKKEVVNHPRKPELELLFSQAQVHFERQEYEKCIDVCDRILHIDPKLSSVDEMKMVAQRLVHVKADRELTRTYIEQWKKVFAQARTHDVNGAVPTQSPEVLRNRKPKGILGAETDEEGASENHYQMALRYYDAGEFEKAELECQKALSLNSKHGASHALMLEVQFALGKGRVTPQSLEFESIIQMSHARQQQVFLETKESLEQGIRAYNQGHRGDAERHFRTIIEYSKWMPQSAEMEAQRRQAAEMLGKLQTPATPSLQPPAGGYDIGGVGFTDVDEWAEQGTFGNLLSDDITPAFSTLPGQQFATFIDPDGGGGPVFRSPSSGSALAGASFFLEDQGFPQEHSQPVEWDVLHRKLVGEKRRGWINQSVTVPGTEESLLTLLNQDNGFLELPREPAGASFALSEPYAESKVEMTSNGGAALSAGEGRSPRGRMGVPVVPSSAGSLESAAEQMSLRLMQQQSALSQVEKLIKLRGEGAEDPKKLGELEDQYQALARDRQRLQETIAALNTTSFHTDSVAPRKPIAGQVTAVAGELDLVVLSVGRDAGVNEGDEFTIYRGNVFTAKVTIDRVDRAWASGRVSLKGREEPRVGDTATNGVLAAPGKLLEIPARPPVRKVLTIKGDDIAISGVDPAVVKKGTCFVLSRDWKYVAAIEVTDVMETVAKARVLRRYRASDIKEGDLAVPVNSVADLWKVLPDSIRQEILSERVLAEARAKLRLLRAMKGGAR